MPGAAGIAELPLMTARVEHPARIATLAATLLALVATALVLLSGSGAGTRASLLSQLERPAVLPSASMGPHRTAITLGAGAYELQLTVSPNRAAAHNTVALKLTRGGVPVKGASAAVTYSMPAMDMQNALSSTLTPSGSGAYRVREPVLGMPGSWVMRLQVRPTGARPVTVTVNDLLR